MDKKKLYILTYDHGGYVLWKDEVKPRLKDIFKWMEKYPKLRIGLDYESFTFDEFSRCDPEIVEMIRELLKKYPDRIGLGATTYGQPLSLTISEESNARQLSYAVKTNMEYFGVTPPVYAISEFALNNQTPQLAKLCGYKAAILRSHVMGYGYTKTFDSAWGRWIGKDKTEMPAVPVYDGQGRGFNCTTVDNWILSRWPRHLRYSLEDFEDMFSKYEPLLASRYDDLTQEIEPLTEHVETKDNYEYVLLEDIPGLYGEAVDELITDDNDFHVQMPWGYCGNEIFNGVRQSEVNAVQAEKLNAISAMLGGETYQNKMDEAWKYALAAQHHDVTICGLLDLSRRFIPASLSASEYVKNESAKTFASRFANKDGKPVAVNMHSFAVDEWVDFNGRKYHITLPSFTAKTVCGSSEKYSFEWKNGVLETPVYRAELTDCGIACLEDKRTGRRIFDNGSESIFTAHIENADCISKGKWDVEIKDTYALAVFEGNIGSIPFRLEMAFNGESPRIDCKTRFELHGEHVGITGEKAGLEKSITVDGHRHDGKLNFNMNLCLDNNRKMFRDLPYSISEWDGQVRVTEDYWYVEDRILIDKKVSPEESFASSTNIEGIYWIGLRDEKGGIAVFNRGCMGGMVKGNRLSIPLVYADLYLCGTKMLDGVYEDEFALMSYDSSVSCTDIHRNAVSYSYQPQVIACENGDGDLDSFEAATLKSCGGEVILTTLYNENGTLYARFCNYSDEPSTADFTCAFGKADAEVDLLCNELAKIDGGKLSFRPWEIKTVRIEQGV